MDQDAIIKNIQEGTCNEDEILKYLKIDYLYVLSNAMREVGEKGYHSAEIIEQLQKWSKYRDIRKHKLFGIDTVGLLAIATLIKIGVKKENIGAYNELDDLFKNRVDILVQEAFGQK